MYQLQVMRVTSLTFTSIFYLVTQVLIVIFSYITQKPLE